MFIENSGRNIRKKRFRSKGNNRRTKRKKIGEGVFFEL